MATATLSATPRTDRGTGVARKLRQAGQVPAVIYGHGREPQSLALNTRELDRLVSGEKVTVSVPLRFTGVADGVRNGGGILEETMHQLHLRLDPTSIPDHIDVDVTPLTIGHSIHVRELTLPEGITVLDDMDATVCVCTAPKAVVETVVAPEAEEGAVPAEPELIRKTKPEDEEEAK